MASNQEVVRAFFAAISAKDEVLLAALVQPDFTWTMMLSANPDGLRAVGLSEAVTRFLKGGDGVFVAGDPKSRLTTLVADRDRIMAETQGSGRRLDGKVYDSVYAWAFELIDGRIARIREYTDTAYALRFFYLAAA